MITGLRIAWERNFLQVCLEMDSNEALEMAINGCPENHPLHSLVDQLKSWSNRAWNLCFQWVYREGNEVAVMSSTSVLSILDEPSNGLTEALRKDLTHVGQERWAGVVS